MRRRPLARALATAAALLLLQSASAGAQSDPSIDNVRLEPSSGGTTTPFVVELPAGSTCPGDSANDGYRVNSYLVPAEQAPAEITFDGLGPQPNALGDYESFRQPLYDVETTPYASVQTAEAEEKGGPGRILDLPPFDFAVFGPGDLPAGTYNIGVVCTLLNEIVRIWGTQIAVTGSGPDDLRWAVTGEQLADDSFPIPPAVLPIAGGAVVLLLLTWRWRRVDRRTPTSESI